MRAGGASKNKFVMGIKFCWYALKILFKNHGHTYGISNITHFKFYVSITSEMYFLILNLGNIGEYYGA